MDPIDTLPEDTETDELHAKDLGDQPDQPEQPPPQADSVELVDEDKPEQSPPPSQARKIEEAAPEPAHAEEAQAKRPRGRPRKEPAAAPAAVQAEEVQAKPTKPVKPAKPPLPDIGAKVTEKLDKKRAEQLDAVKGLLQLQASKIASLACMAVGWEPLNSEESLLVDAEFEGWQPPEEMRKVVVVGIVALPRALGDNRVRSVIGLPLLGAAGDQAAANAAKVQAEMQQQQAAPPPPVAPPPVQPEPAPQTRPEPAPQSGAVESYSPLFNGAAAKVPKGFM
jgi:hypothetical protein